MTTRCAILRIILTLAAALGCSIGAPALAADDAGPEPDTSSSSDAALQAWAAQAAQITPTVTKEMGDRGGFCFGQIPKPESTRHYYIAAELDAWDFAPTTADPLCGPSIPANVLENHVAMKVRYFQYTDATFSTRVLQTPRVGILGPVLRGVVGETLAVTFLNKTQFPLSMHPHGVKYDKDSEGAFYRPAPGLGAAVGPGARFTYVWQLDESSGPLPGEPSSKCWLYHSHVCGDVESNLGLVGMIIVTDPKRARPDGTPSDVDREMASLFTIFDESGIDEEAAEEAAAAGGTVEPSTVAPAVGGSREQGLRYAINGYIYGNLPGLEIIQGERVRWYLLALGDENDLHTPHWHGLRVIEDGRRRTDVIELLPASMKVADLVADNPGIWLFHCHVAEHMKNGMFANVIVHPESSEPTDRSPETAFLGLPAAGQTLKIDSTRILPPLPSDPTRPRDLRIKGRVTVPEVFSLGRDPITLQIGDKSWPLTPDRRGTAQAGGLTFRVSNCDRYGIVYGSELEFEIIVPLQSLGIAAEDYGNGPEDTRKRMVPVRMTIGQIKHQSVVSIP